MDSITLQNFRCFRDQQVARLAPLTLLVGENSTGKTSFMEMIRALWDVAYRNQIPDFKEPPYDLGSFDEIAHHRGRGGSRVEKFEAGFSAILETPRGKMVGKVRPYEFSITFKKDGTVPVPLQRRLIHEDMWIEQNFTTRKKSKVRFGIGKGSWESEIQGGSIDIGQNSIRPFLHLFYFGRGEILRQAKPLTEESNSLTEHERESLEQFIWKINHHEEQRPYASAPVRSKPHRTYDPARLSPDPEGDYVPMYLVDLHFRHREAWDHLEAQIEAFGKAAGLFDEISIKSVGTRESAPFQVQIRKSGGRLKGSGRNLLDVGYGVSQVLPVVIELLRSDVPPVFLLQQPEVHLHPSAQAALGSLFCKVASLQQQLIVETHSDYILDRVRMDVRDQKGNLKPDDVSILFFERKDLDVQIHSLRLDEQGNILNTPPGYRRFFMEEQERSLGI